MCPAPTARTNGADLAGVFQMFRVENFVSVRTDRVEWALLRIVFAGGGFGIASQFEQGPHDVFLPPLDGGGEDGPQGVRRGTVAGRELRPGSQQNLRDFDVPAATSLDQRLVEVFFPVQHPFRCAGTSVTT